MRSIYLYLKMFYELLPDNFRNSKQRLSSLFNKLKKQSEKLKEYHGIISSQIAENIIEVAGNTPVPGRCHYLSHHPVYKESSTSTKTRIYDASSKQKGPSLIDCLESDTDLLPQLLEIILGLRANKVGIICDIKQVFLNVSIQQSDRDFLRFLWLKDIQNEPSLITLRFTRAVFVSTSSQFLLASVVRKLLKTYKNSSTICCFLFEKSLC